MADLPFRSFTSLFFNVKNPARSTQTGILIRLDNILMRVLMLKPAHEIKAINDV